jgi:hypothetical protein
MYIPMVEIPGCRPGYRNDNRGTGHPLEMQTAAENEPNPRETVAIHFSSLPPTYEAAAEFYSYIAYPDATHATQFSLGAFDSCRRVTPKVLSGVFPSGAPRKGTSITD